MQPRPKAARTAAMSRKGNGNKARIILWDIECSNLSADFGRILCIGWMELGEDKPHIISSRTSKAWQKDPTDDRAVLAEARTVLANADLWVTHYGARFDVPFMQTRLLRLGFDPLPYVPNVDTWRTMKYRLRLRSNRLATACDFFDLTPKTPLRGEQWVRAAAGHAPSLKYIEEHCAADVLALRDCYLLLRPLVYNHPNVGLADEATDVCPACGSDTWHEAGTHFGPKRLYTRWSCKHCKHAAIAPKRKE
jgi:hypothetical protein